MQIRPATQSDIPFLWQMLQEAIHVEPGETKPSIDELANGPLAHYLAGWGRPGDCAFIAQADGVPVGAAWYRLLTGADRGYGYVADEIPELSIALLPAARGQGAGTQLVQRLIDQAKVDGYPGLSLSVDPRNAALRLYQRLGFTYVETSGTSWTMLLRFA